MKLIESNIAFFQQAKKYSMLNLSLCKLKVLISKCTPLFEEIRKFAPDFDFDEKTPANGYRSFVDIFDIALLKTTGVLEKLQSIRKKMFFNANSIAK